MKLDLTTSQPRQPQKIKPLEPTISLFRPVTSNLTQLKRVGLNPKFKPRKLQQSAAKQYIRRLLHEFAKQIQGAKYYHQHDIGKVFNLLNALSKREIKLLLKYCVLWSKRQQDRLQDNKLFHSKGNIFAEVAKLPQRYAPDPMDELTLDLSLKPVKGPNFWPFMLTPHYDFHNLTQLLFNCTQLRRLTFHLPYLYKYFINQFNLYLSKCSSLTELDLKLRDTNKHLYQVYLSNLKNTLCSLPNLAELSLTFANRHLELKDENLTDIAELVAAIPNLVKLELAFNNNTSITKQGLFSLSDKLATVCQRLITLRLNFNDCSGSENLNYPLLHLTRNFKQCPTLKTLALDLGKCQFSSSAISREFFTKIAQLPELSRLDLSIYKLSFDDLALAIEQLGKLAKLSQLHLQSKTLLDEQQWLTLKASFSTLAITTIVVKLGKNIYSNRRHTI